MQQTLRENEPLNHRMCQVLSMVGFESDSCRNSVNFLDSRISHQQEKAIMINCDSILPREVLTLTSFLSIQF